MKSAPKVVLLGSRASISAIGFRLLRERGARVSLVISGDEDSGKDDWRLSLAGAAREANYRDGNDLLVLHDPHTPEVLARLRAIEPDLVLSLQWRRILRPPLLGIPRFGVVNLHNAPLPLLRGCDPFSWAIHDGLEVMGVTLHRVVDEGVDSGPILAQRLWPIESTATAWDLYLSSLVEAEKLLRAHLDGLLANRLPPRPQEGRYASYHPIRQFRFDHLKADWNQPAVTLSAALRARVFPPFQLPFLIARGQRVEILRCRAVCARGKPGIVASRDPFVIGARPGALEISRVRFNGEELEGAELARRLDLPTDTAL